MVHYLVVVGDEEEAHHAAQAALHHVYPGRDKVLLLTIIDIVAPDPNAIDVSFVDAKQRRLEAEAKEKMRITGNQFVNINVDCSLVALANDHPGKAICKAVVDHHIEALIVGNKELGVFQKMLGTSTAKYCVEHAECNVIVIKKAYPHGILATHPAAAQPASVTVTPAIARAPAPALDPSIFNVTPNPVPVAPRVAFTTLRTPEEFVGRIPAQVQALASNSPKITDAPRREAKPGQSKLEVELQDELHRIQIEHRALLDRIQQMEEDEIARSHKQKEQQIAAELARKRAEGNQDLELVRNLEEEERKRRLEEEVSGEQEVNERKHNIHTANQLEDEEKARRISLWKEQVASLEQRHQTLEYTRSLEEKERQDRVQKWKAEDEATLTKRALESSQDLELVKKLEAQEQQERVETLHKELSSEEAEQKEHLRQHLKELATLEEQERKRRIRLKEEEDQKERMVRKSESMEDIALVAKLEEEERERRINEEKEHQSH